MRARKTWWLILQNEYVTELYWCMKQCKSSRATHFIVHLLTVFLASSVSTVISITFRLMIYAVSEIFLLTNFWIPGLGLALFHSTGSGAVTRGTIFAKTGLWPGGQNCISLTRQARNTRVHRGPGPEMGRIHVKVEENEPLMKRF